MKKLLIIGFVSLTAVSIMASATFAMGNCSGKSKTKTVDSTPVTETDKS